MCSKKIWTNYKAESEERMKIGDVYYEKHTVVGISKRTNTVSETDVEIVNMLPIEVLDEIRAEIEAKKEDRCFDDDDMYIYMTGLNDAIDIIDMHKAENNVKETGCTTIGHWIKDGKPWGGMQGWKCSKCNQSYDINKIYTNMPYHFCPNCGDKKGDMEEGEILEYGPTESEGEEINTFRSEYALNVCDAHTGEFLCQIDVFDTVEEAEAGTENFRISKNETFAIVRIDYDKDENEIATETEKIIPCVLSKEN